MRASPMAGSSSSSSSDSSASQSSSTTSIDQTLRTQLRTLELKAVNDMQDNLKPPPPPHFAGGTKQNETGSGSYSSNSNSSSYNKRYKFGLTNHFLTMPVSDSAEDQARRVETYQRELDNLRKRHAPKRKEPARNSKQVIDLNLGKGPKRTRGQRGGGASNLHDQMNSPAAITSDDECDLSVLAGSSLPDANSLLSEVEDDDDENELGVWRGQENLLASSQHTNGQLSSDGDSSSRPLTGKSNKTPAAMMRHHQTRPAGDAGLDAVQCNSKAADDYYLSSPAHNNNHHHHNHHHRHQLMRAGGDKNPTGSASNTRHPMDSTASSSLSSLHQQHHLKKKRKLNGDPEDCASNGLLLKFSSIMYATFLVILGCILHVSELKQKSRNSSDHIYTIVVASIGIVWLIFLQSDLQRYKKYASKFILLESILNDHTSQQRQDGLLTVDPTGHSISSSSASLVNDRMSMNTEVIFKKTAYKMYQHQAAQPKLRLYTRDELARDNNNHVGLKPASAYGRPTSRPNYHHSATDCSSNSILGDRMESSSSSSSATAAAAPQLVPAYKFLHGKMGANFYLKCGMAAFCFGHVIHEGLRFGQQVYFFATSNAACRDSAALAAHLVTPLYSFYQLFMMFKYSNLVINRHKVLARFGLMHIIGTCVTFWFRTILEEAFEDFVHKMDYFKSQNKPIKQYLDPTNLLQVSPQFERVAIQNQLPTTTTTTTTSTSTGASGLVGLLDWLNSVTSSDESSPLASSRLNQSSPRVAPARALPLENSELIPGQNMSLAQSAALLALMSSPLSATITPQLVRHLPDSYHCAQNTLLTTKSMNALPYLYPFTIEYNLLIAATFLSLYFNIGKVGSSARRGCNPAHCKPLADQYHRLGPASCGLSFVGSQPDLVQEHEMSKASDVHVDQPRHQHLNLSGPINHLHHNHLSQQQQQQHPMQQAGGEYKSNFVVNADCHAANKGLFLGFFVLLVTLVTIVIFFVTISKPNHVQLGIKINLIQEATLTSLILVVTLAGYRQIMRLTRNPFIKDKVTTDDVLMLIPLPFFFIHSLLSFRAETATLYSSHAQNQQQQQQLVDGQLALLGQPRAPRDTLHLEAAEMAARRLNVAGSEGLRTASAVAAAAAAADGRGVTSSSEKFRRPDELMLANRPPATTQRASANKRANNATRSLVALSSRLQTNATTSTISPNVSTSGHDDQTSGTKRRAKSIDSFKLLTIVLNLAVMLEVLVQTNFIIDGLRRCSESRLLRFKKPGRELITFAILLNITYWIVATFETKSVEQYKTEIDYYGPLPYMFISHTTLPVMLFYRYHSSVCLAEIWNRAYKPPKRR